MINFFNTASPDSNAALPDPGIDSHDGDIDSHDGNAALPDPDAASHDGNAASPDGDTALPDPWHCCCLTEQLVCFLAFLVGAELGLTLFGPRHGVEVELLKP